MAVWVISARCWDGLFNSKFRHGSLAFDDPLDKVDAELHFPLTEKPYAITGLKIENPSARVALAVLD